MPLAGVDELSLDVTSIPPVGDADGRIDFDTSSLRRSPLSDADKQEESVASPLVPEGKEITPFMPLPLNSPPGSPFLPPFLTPIGSYPPREQKSQPSIQSYHPPEKDTWTAPDALQLHSTRKRRTTDDYKPTTTKRQKIDDGLITPPFPSSPNGFPRWLPPAGGHYSPAPPPTDVSFATARSNLTNPASFAATAGSVIPRSDGSGMGVRIHREPYPMYPDSSSNGPSGRQVAKMPTQVLSAPSTFRRPASPAFTPSDGRSAALMSRPPMHMNPYYPPPPSNAGWSQYPYGPPSTGVLGRPNKINRRPVSATLSHEALDRPIDTAHVDLLGERLTFSTRLEDREIAVQALLRIAQDKAVGEAAVKGWFTGSYYGCIALFSFADIKTPTGMTLDVTSPVASLIDFLMERIGYDALLTPVLQPDTDGCVALRYVLQKHARHALCSPMWDGEDYIRHVRCVIERSGNDSFAWVHAVRLLELVMRVFYRASEPDSLPCRDIVRAIIGTLGQPLLTHHYSLTSARRIVVLQLLSSSWHMITFQSRWSTRTTRVPRELSLPTELVGQMFDCVRVDDLERILHDSSETGIGRCLALQSIRNLAEADPPKVKDWTSLGAIVATSAKTMLQVAEWTKDLEIQERCLDIDPLLPHEDAYRILCLSPREMVLSDLSTLLAEDTELRILPALRDLFDAQTRTDDKHWPTMLSMLLNAGTIGYLYGLANGRLPEAEDTLTARIMGSSLKVLSACFEQMRAKDMRLVGKDVFPFLKRLSNEESLPEILRSDAVAAFEALKDNIIPDDSDVQ